jgi:UPF0716 protein FxsA
MLALLALLFLVVPIAELAVIVAVAHSIGLGNTILALVLMSVAGAWLAKREGVGVVRRLQESVNQGRVPTTEVVDGALILLAGALMLAPGFLTDALAIVLLVPPTRAVVRAVVVRSLKKRAVIVQRVGGWVGDVGDMGAGIVDAESWEQPTRDRSAGELGSRRLDHP